LQNLVLCSACHRHFRARDGACPFCGASVALASAPRAFSVLGPGASRSRRYAASAAFLASSAAFACGETSNDDGNPLNNAGTGGERTQSTGGASSGQGGSKTGQGGSKTGQGGSNAGEGGIGEAGSGAATTGGATTSTGGIGEAGSGGAATGGATTSTGGRTTTTGGATAAGGNASAGSAGTNATGRACEGYDDRNGCHSAEACFAQPGGIGSVSCVLVAPPRSCGNPMFQPQCPDQGCGDGLLCVQQDCGSQCVPECTNTSCPAGSGCVDGQCEALPCSETQVPCPDGYECDFDATGPGNHCVAVRCDTGNFECEPWQDCAQRPGVDAHGCVPHECTADADCGTCGYCVEQRCAPQLGICYQIVAMPYGCVWPDEELL
jgi:hypothetical protein